MLGLNPAQLTALRARLDRLPWLGVREGQSVDTDGYTLAWAIPQQTASGQWAVPSFLGGGVPEPAWPVPPIPAG
jgi:hypothetical protein